MKRYLILIWVILFMAACGPSIRVISDYDETINFGQYESFEFYGWAEESEQILSRFDQQRIEEAVKQEFENRGINQVESQGDLIVSLIAVVEERTERRAYTTYHNPGFRYFGYHYGFGPRFPWGPGYATTTYRDFDYHVGTLVIDVFDAREEILIWEGAGSQVIEERPERRERTIPRAVASIMEEFPIPIQRD